MPEETEFLFIGGPKDGERISVDTTLESVHFPVLKEGTVYKSTLPIESLLGSCEYVRYLPVRFQGWKKEFTIYVCEGTNPDDVMDALIGSYCGLMAHGGVGT